MADSQDTPKLTSSELKHLFGDIQKAELPFESFQKKLQALQSEHKIESPEI